MREWEDVESAPRDGTEFDAWSGKQRVPNVYWGERSARGFLLKELGIKKSGWCCCGEDGWVYPVEVTHWMPIPDGPK